MLCLFSHSFKLKYRSTFCVLKKLKHEIISCHVHVRDSNSKCKMVRVLNVAEKNDAAKSISEIMSRGGMNRREGKSVYNKIYEFEYNLFNQRCTMIMTSVSGHLLNLEFSGSYRKWHGCNPVTLFDAPVSLECLPDYQPIKLTLEQEVRNCQYLIIWTDGDREGENIGFEIIEVCKKVKPNIKVYRARFSEITPQAISRACANLCQPDKHVSDAVNVRRELDLRIGAAFTRFQTLRLTKVFSNVLNDQLISYGSCQFPTLGFVVERYKAVQAFIPEPFWKIKVSHTKDKILTEFSWKRGRLFHHAACLVLYHKCLEEPIARVVDVKSRNKSKWRPQPLDTVEFEKLASRKLRINAKEAMNIAEKLYTRGIISYPRTETNIFPKELDLSSLVEMQCQAPNWGEFARRVLEDGPNPRQGNKTDNAHPPIHPTKYADNLQGNEMKVYELVVRHFLACVSKDAEGRETTIEIDVNNERFAVNGLVIIARNYLDVYPYDKWNAKVIGQYDLNEVFEVSSIEMTEGETTAPELLTEADLIGLMEKHGIGTDATHAEHIETIKSRHYVGLNENNRFVPGELGMGLVEGYDVMGFHMSKPHLRAELEADLKKIAEGTKNPDAVLREHVGKYKQCFIEVVRQASKLDSALSTYLNCTPSEVSEENHVLPDLIPVMKCPKCQTGDIVIRKKKDNKGFFLSCLSFPSCNAAMWLPQSLEELSVSDQECEKCIPRSIKKLKFKFKPGSLLPFYPDVLVNCLGGCDLDFLNVINVHPLSNSGNPNGSTSSPFLSSRITNSESGYESNSNASSFGQRNRSSTSRSRSVSSIRSNSQQSLQSSNQQASRQNNTVNSSNQDVVCNCGKNAILLTVRKEGPNTGRQFYRCPEMSDATKCDFFLWKDDEQSSASHSSHQAQNNSFSRQPSHQAQNNSFSRQPSITRSNLNENQRVGSIPSCQCPNTAVLKHVIKDGPNKGRPFYCCSKPQSQGCGFFKWADLDGGDLNHAPSTHSGGSDRPSFSNSRRRRGDSNTGGPASKRKCGICSQPGHNRKNCPQNR